MADEYVNTTNHAQQVASGAFIPAFAASGKVAVDPKDPHDAALIEDGALIPADKPSPKRKAGEEH